MGEPAPPLPQPQLVGRQQIILIATVGTVVFFTILLVGLRSCSARTEKESSIKQTAVTQKTRPVASTDSSHVVIYSNLDLKDAAMVITRLKELKIPYQIKDEGRSIAVARNKADEARLGLAEKNLPGGGSVGWEIFDQAKLGATDFDRRIQFIRAISGELARTIKRINIVEDARVQIVIPETKLFEVSKAPVTASVLVKLYPGAEMSPRQVNGIVRLVAGSVENLKSENVTIIDVDGNVLTGGGYTEVPEVKPEVRKEVETAQAPKTEEMKEEVVIQKTEGKQVSEVKSKLDLEEKLTSKVQSLLNKLFPPNITISRVNIESAASRKMTVIILVDKKFSISKELKRSTFETVAAAVGYDKTRGDKIVMKSVKFHAAGQPEQPQAKIEKEKQSFVITALKWAYRKFGIGKMALAVLVFIILTMISLLMLLRPAKKQAMPSERSMTETPKAEGAEEVVEGTVPAEEENIPVIEEMKVSATQSPEKVAELIKEWLAEEAT